MNAKVSQAATSARFTGYGAGALIVCFALLLCSLGSSAWANLPSNAVAAESSPAAKPSAPIVQALSEPKLFGQARLSVFGFNIYEAALWAEPSFSVADFERLPFALELRYARNFSGDMLAERSLKEMRRLATISDETAKVWLEEMRRTFPDVKKGDQLIGIHHTDGSAKFVLNGKPIGSIRNAQFTQLFFGIWLNPKTSEPKMRQALIGASSAGAKR